MDLRKQIHVLASGSMDGRSVAAARLAGALVLFCAGACGRVEATAAHWAVVIQTAP
jgi:hypothetical protein